jgi:hypothetical protein
MTENTRNRVGLLIAGIVLIAIFAPIALPSVAAAAATIIVGSTTVGNGIGS